MQVIIKIPMAKDDTSKDGRVILSNVSSFKTSRDNIVVKLPKYDDYSNKLNIMSKEGLNWSIVNEDKYSLVLKIMSDDNQIEVFH